MPSVAEACASSNAGRVGLKNLGNTCFMNTGLQCLSHLEPLVNFFLSGQYKEEINTSNPLGSGGKLAEAFAHLQKMMWLSEKSPRNPQIIHNQLSLLAPHLFEDYQQQDVQEFLAFCLDALHEDVNRVRGRPKAEGNIEESAESLAALGEEYAAAVAWLKYLEHGKSFFVDLFQGQLRSTLTCQVCGNKSRRFDSFLYLSVPVTRTMRTIEDAIRSFLQEELLTDDERWFCDRCNKKVNAKKKIDLWKLPPVLVVHLKRFEFNQKKCAFHKIDVLLSAAEQFDFTRLCSSQQKAGARYRAACVANHIGPYGSGHYTAFCRVNGSNRNQGEWLCFDDGRTYPLQQGDEPIGKHSYVIFLVREEPNGSSICMPKRQSISSPAAWPHSLSRRNSVMEDLISGRAGLAALTASAACKSSPSTSKPESLRFIPPARVKGTPQVALCEGWLSKRGPTIVHRWIQRWCVLLPGVFLWYNDASCEALIGQVDIGPETQALFFGAKGAPGDAIKHCRERPFGFVVDVDSSAGPSRQLFFFDAESSPALRNWLELFQVARSSLGTRTHL